MVKQVSDVTGYANTPEQTDEDGNGMQVTDAGGEVGGGSGMVHIEGAAASALELVGLTSGARDGYGIDILVFG